MRSIKLIRNGAYIEISYPPDDIGEGESRILKVLPTRPERLHAAYGAIVTDDGRNYRHGIIPIEDNPQALGAAVAWPNSE